MRELSTGRKRFIFKSCYILSIYSLICNLIRYSQLVGDFPSSVVDSTLLKNGLFISLTRHCRLTFLCQSTPQCGIVGLFIKVVMKH